MLTNPVTHDTYWNGKASQAIKGAVVGGIKSGWQKQAADYFNLDDPLGDGLVFTPKGVLY
jgi:hypothetical protein